ncbi:MAG: hypothetical protein L6306_10230 [Planctomycetales bacterium]|nr:hypothetical protein [Planctomycetales bacterium]
MTTQEILPRFQGVRKTAAGWEARCPSHEDATASLSIGTGDDGRTLLHCHGGCPLDSILAKVNLQKRDLFASPNGDGRAPTARREVAHYNYHDADGTLLFQVVRFDPKDFRQRRPKEGGGWEWKLGDTRRVLYRLPELLAADKATIIYIVEGEKDTGRLNALGLVATTCPGGAGKWRRAEYNTYLRGRRVVILPDADGPGRKHAQQVATSLHGVAASVKVLELPELAEKQDVSDWLDAGHAAEELSELAAATAEWAPTDSTDLELTDRSTIIVGADEPRVVDEAVVALSTCKNVYQRGCLVHIIEGTEPPRGIVRPKESPRIAPMKHARIRELLAASAKWLRPASEGKMERIHPPDWCVKAIDARGQWEGIRRLEAVVETPVLRANGTVLQTPGYDPQTGIVFRPECNFPPIPEQPTAADAANAVCALVEVVEDFPFATEANRAAWLASLLTPLARYAFHGPAPLFLHDANVRGCGKSLLTDATAIIVSGRDMARMSQPRDDDEFRKRITALAVAGEPLILIDNVAGSFGSPSLDAALTATSWSDRILGATAMVSGVPLYSTWYATGNNIILVGDTARRAVHVRLESPLENPEERIGFHHSDLLNWIRQERPRLAAAAITILSAYAAAGRPDMKLTPWGSFEAWSALVRNAVAWCGLPDPGATRTELNTQADREAVALRQLIVGWEEMDPFRRGLTLAEVMRTLTEHPRDYDTLRSALLELAPPKDGRTLNPRSIGQRLYHLRRRVVGGKFIDRRTAERKEGMVWIVCGDGGIGGIGGNV